MENFKLHKAFIITDKEIYNENVPIKVNLTNDYHLYISEDVTFESYIYNEDAVHILGYAIDIMKPNDSTYHILKGIFNEKLSAKSHYVNMLNGSFVIIKVKGGLVELFSDAAGFRSPYYTSDLMVVSSHDKLIGDLFNKKKKYQRINALDYSRYEDVYKLVPSLKLSIGNETERVFPNPNFNHHRYQEILSEMKKHVKNLNIALNERDNKLLVGITGGIDSKCTLALSKALGNKVGTFTYMKDIYGIQDKRARQIYKNDKMIVNRLIKNININHEFIEFNVNDVDQVYSKNMFEWTGTTFNHPIAEIFEKKYEKELDDVLQFRSVIFSNAKFDYPKEFLNKDLSMQDIYEHIHHKQLKDLSYDKVVDATNDYIKRTHTNIHTDNFIELLDIIHIDSRMGNWHSQLVKETDKVMDFFNYLNDRKTLNLLLHLPHEIRMNNLFHKDLINTYWPILNFFEDNGSGTLYDHERNEILQTIAAHGGILNETNMKFDLDEEMYVLIPKVNLKDTQKLKYKVDIKREKEGLLFSKYSNPKGKNYISVKILNDNKEEVIDAVDLSKGYHLLPNQFYEIEILYHKPTTTASWVKAGTLYLK
ncbi:hypothetical protein BHU61_02240 [Macrococcus epidermidis]|uniref:Asparagine synthetase domain-containing protein n=1 Tax=Macrococcus epidermidis TaxID=1902580 RepID=A0A327ZZ08_9STAP|nr:hypothetical protein [Macrococcus epidermidis]RAK46288.1 hypothetical protein BHU61_02240 [Macrococcus epidermidis]